MTDSATPRKEVQHSLSVVFEPPHYPNHTKPEGFLSADRRAQACWHFYTLAQLQKEKVGDSIDDQFALLDTALWMDTHYVQTARTVAMIHGLESPDEFAKAWHEVRAEAARCGLPTPSGVYTQLTPRFFLR